MPKRSPKKPAAKRSVADRTTKDDSAKPNRLSTDGSLEAWLWDAACSIRGAVDAPKFKDYILPLIFLKRLSDVFDDEVDGLAAKFDDRETAVELIEDDHTLVRFYVPPAGSWTEVRKLTQDVGQQLTQTLRKVAKANPGLQGVIDVVDFNAAVSGQRIVEDGRLKTLIEILSRHELGLDDVEPDILGRAYEYLLRKFAEGQGQSAGEFFTPKEVGWLIARLLRAEQGMRVYDPACGSAGLLVKSRLLVRQESGQVEKPLQLFGQERNHATYAIAQMNMIIHDMEGAIAIGDTLRSPKLLSDSRLQTFDLVTANPMWMQRGYDKAFYENDTFDRFARGIPPESSADWGWVQHMSSSLNDRGRAVIVLDPGVVSRGSGGRGSNRERDIRKRFVEDDLVEAVILLPENLFYNTNAPGVLLCLNKSKRPELKEAVLIINASRLFGKGAPKNFLTDEGLERIGKTFLDASEEADLSVIVPLDRIRARDYNLSPGLHVPLGTDAEVLTVEEAVVLVGESAEDRVAVDTTVADALECFCIQLDDFRVTGPNTRRDELQDTEIGQLPAHWDVTTVDELFAIQQGKSLSRRTREGGNQLPFLRTANVLWARLDLSTLDTMHFSEAEEEKYRLQPRDLLVCEGGEIGRAAIWGGEVVLCCYQNHIHRLRAKHSEAEPEFYMYWFQLAIRMFGLYVGEGNRTTIANLSKSRLASFRVPKPPIEEQRAIARALCAVQDGQQVREREAGSWSGMFDAVLHETLTGRRPPRAVSDG